MCRITSLIQPTITQTVQVKLREVAPFFHSYNNLIHISVNSIAKTSVYQLQKTDVRVNSVCPGLIETSMTKGMFDAARERGSGGKLGQLNPMGRYGIPQGTYYIDWHPETPADLAT